LELEVEAGILEGRGQIDDGLSNLVNLLLRRYLKAVSIEVVMI
jgi:hypothetical protein